MFKLKSQLAKLLGHSVLTSFQLAGAAWVALLAARGFSMVEIGLAESVFHMASLLFEIPSGVRETVCFLLTQAAARRLMLLKTLAGAVATLLSFFLQARLPLAGLEHAYLGPALFVMGLGGAVGSRLALRLAGMRYGRLYALCFGGILVGLLLGAGHVPAAMVAGGFAANVFDDLLQVRTDSLLNEKFPSSQRSTLISVSSLCFSLVMIGLSPLAGGFFAMLS